MTARKYNPGFQSDDELVASFCVRTPEFASIVETLRECAGSSNTHQIVIGPRGSGKTSLLLRVAAEIIRDDGLATFFFPVVFAEESYEVSTAGEFWLECLSRLADRAPRREDGPDWRRSFEELRTIRDDRMLGDRCLGALQDFADREGKRLVLFVENLNMMFGDMADKNAGWRLRQTLQTEPRIVLLASATSRFDEMDNRDKALYDLFRVLTLRPLDTDDCAALWRKVSGQSRAPQTIQALRILTGGSPRLLTIVARFGAQLSFRELMADLLNLVDDHTEYFKSHLDALPAQERRVYLALADLWKPATAREIADRARLDTSKCSAHLARLTDKGAVEMTGGTARRRLYYLAERLYNIYYLMRRARGPAPLIEALIRFMEGYYSADELKEFGARIAREAPEIDGKVLSHYRTAFEQLVRLPSLAAHRDELLSLTPVASALVGKDSDFSDAGPSVSRARQLFENGASLARSGRLQEAVAAWKDLVRRFEGSEAPDDRNHVSLALVNMGTAFRHLNRSEEALAVWDDATRRFGGSWEPTHFDAIATALVSKAELHIEENRPLEALAACDEVLMGVRETRTESLQILLAKTLRRKAIALMELSRPSEALAACDELLRRFGASRAPELDRYIALAMIGRGAAFINLGRLGAAVAAWSQLAECFETSEDAEIAWNVSIALVDKATALVNLGRAEEALAACDRFLERQEKSNEAAPGGVIATALLNKGYALRLLNRLEPALAAWSECARRFGQSPTEQEPVAWALMYKGMALSGADRPEEALAALGDIVQRFGTSDRPQMRAVIVRAFTKMGSLLKHMTRHEEALAVWEDVERRFGTGLEPEFQELVAGSFVYRGNTLVELGRLEEALAVLDRAVRQFEASEAPGIVHAVAVALPNKGSVLSMLNRAEEAAEVWREAVQRFGTSDAPALRHATDTALIGLAGDELRQRRSRAAAETADRVLRHEAVMPDNRWRAHLLRAQARLNEGDKAACALDIEEGLGILPDLDVLPKEAPKALSDIAAEFGLAEMSELIRKSPASDLLLPLTTAIERESGLEPRVAKEVEEVAEDIRRDMRERRRS